MARQVTVKGYYEYIKSKDNRLIGVKWVDDPNGKHTIHRIEYNLFERLLIWLKVKRGKCHNGKYIIGVDPFDAETSSRMTHLVGRDYKLSVNNSSDEKQSQDSTGHPADTVNG